MNPIDIQHNYYTQTADAYDDWHGEDEPLTRYGLPYLSSLIDSLNAKTLLDVGAGSGRTLAHVQRFHPQVRPSGVEPVAALIEKANAKGVHSIIEGDGRRLPFADDSIDIVCEFAVLHHTSEPALVVSEMCRVARRAVFIADANRFGQGDVKARWLKLAIYKARLWPAFEYARTKGKGYHVSEGDGLFYSYSVFDNLATLSKWANRLMLLPADDQKPRSWFHPLLTSSQMIAIAIKT